MRIMILTGALLSLASPSSLSAQCLPMPDLFLSTAATAGHEATIFTTPAGTGPSLSEAMDDQGNIVDAQIEVTILDADGRPRVGFPADRIMLAPVGPLAVACEPLHASGPTDVHGRTTFDGVPAWGGSVEPGYGHLQVYVCWSELIGSDISLRVLSPDLDSDGKVGLSDVVIFAPLYLDGAYHPEIDYHHDSAISLSDLVLFASGLNQECAAGD